MSDKYEQGINQPQPENDELSKEEMSEDELDQVAGGAMDGISRLIAVTQMKANNANDEALAKG